MSIIYCLLDGLGLTADPEPPWTSATLPAISLLVGGIPAARISILRQDLTWVALDATMGVPGLPQSGSGHTTLLTGVNSAVLLGGYHQPAFPTATLQRVIAEHSLLRRATEAGLRAFQATAYPQHYWDLVTRRRLRASAGALAARAAGLTLPSLPELLVGRALPWDITGEYLRQRPELAALSPIVPHEAGRRLAMLARQYDLVFYESYLPDFVGHRRISIAHEAALEIVDGLMAGLLDWRRSEDTLVVVSDHGNIEEPEHRHHTRNSVPLCVVGPAAPLFQGVRSIEEVVGALLRALGLPEAQPEVACDV